MYVNIFQDVMLIFQNDSNNNALIHGISCPYTLGNSMRALALLSLVGGQDFWKSVLVRAASR
jgi:hypothetical protein